MVPYKREKWTDTEKCTVLCGVEPGGQSNLPLIFQPRAVQFSVLFADDINGRNIERMKNEPPICACKDFVLAIMNLTRPSLQSKKKSKFWFMHLFLAQFLLHHFLHLLY